MEISTESGVVITYIIRQTVPLHKECQYRMNFWIQGFYQTKLWYSLFILFLKRSWFLLPTSRSLGIFKVNLRSGYHLEVNIHDLLWLFYIIGTWLSRFWTCPQCPLYEGTLGFRNVLSFQSPYHLRGSPTDCASSFRRSTQIPEYVVVTRESTCFSIYLYMIPFSLTFLFYWNYLWTPNSRYCVLLSLVLPQNLVKLSSRLYRQFLYFWYYFMI